MWIFLVFLALAYIAYQLRENSINLKRQMYVDTLTQYFSLRETAMYNHELQVMYETDFDIAKVNVGQCFYIHTLIAFCEGLYLTKQINPFKDVIGGNWENFIRHTLSIPAVRAIWDEEAQCPSESDYADDFIAYASRLLT